MKDVVAIVRVRERRGSAIGVCESPPLLELGKSAAEVAERLKHRLLELISPDGAKQVVLVKRDDLGLSEMLLLR